MILYVLGDVKSPPEAPKYISGESRTCARHPCSTMPLSLYRCTLHGAGGLTTHLTPCTWRSRSLTDRTCIPNVYIRYAKPSPKRPRPCPILSNTFKRWLEAHTAL